MKHVDPARLLIVDIETATEFADYDSMNDDWKKLWKAKVAHLATPEKGAADLYRERGGVMAEFARIVCISTGYFIRNHNFYIKIRSFSDRDEGSLLHSFIQYLNVIFSKHPGTYFAGHNIREFDIPFLCRRLLANRIAIPSYLDFQQMKPWETNLADSFQYWRFGDYKQFTSLNLLAAVLQVPSSKDDMNGSMVGDMFWKCGTEEEKRESLYRIVRYCEKDVVTSGNILLRLMGMPILKEDDIIRDTVETDQVI